MAGVDRSGRGFNPRPAQDRRAPPPPISTLFARRLPRTQQAGNGKQKQRGQNPTVPVCAGRGLNPRPESSTHARAEEQRTERRNQLKDSSRGMFFRIWNCGKPFSGGGSFRSGVQPPTGSGKNGGASANDEYYVVIIPSASSTRGHQSGGSLNTRPDGGGPLPLGE